ncbi:acyl-CoA N-acyltransferase [Nemania abortiva]|nr:acyl-CoA N-acyltransferase [Nemania abortiva]
MSTQTNDTPAPAIADAPSKHTIPKTAIAVAEKCYLRPFEVSDAEAIAEAANDPEIKTYMRSRFPSPYVLADALGWIEHCRSGKTQSFGIFTPESGEYVGSITLELPTGDKVYHGTRELGYFLARKAWGRGIMSQAVRELTRWAFATYPELLRIEATAFAPNEASQHVLRKAGFVKEGMRRLAIVKDGKQMDEAIFGLIRTDIEA